MDTDAIVRTAPTANRSPIMGTPSSNKHFHSSNKRLRASLPPKTALESPNFALDAVIVYQRLEDFVPSVERRSSGKEFCKEWE